MLVAREKWWNGRSLKGGAPNVWSSAFRRLCCTALLAVSACNKPASSGSPPTAAPWFEDITATVGLDFKHDSGTLGTYFMPESAGSGGALFDFDNDGRLDVYLVHNVPP